MALSVVIDASVAIAFVGRRDLHHAAAYEAILCLEDPPEIAATSAIEFLVGPMRSGGDRLAVARRFLADCRVVAVSEDLAESAASLRARHPALSVPDAICIALATVAGASEVWTFDHRWASVDARVQIPPTP